jgi:hypothetical protein
MDLQVLPPSNDLERPPSNPQTVRGCRGSTTRERKKFQEVRLHEMPPLSLTKIPVRYPR